MILPLKLQFSIVLFSFFGGILAGVFFDIYRLIRGFKLPKLIMIVEDILFWILCSLSIFTFLLVVNYAFLNIYVYSILILGFIFYLATFSKYLVKVENNVAILISTVFRIVFKNIRYVIKNIFIK
ncbi:spore cortex biosynthesis protein YabQ [Clostridium massiliamazoniense]|uniref:spore cortex biosynthesis protein YabQ n=1 Tax=Clostridium massiliamazoniense TaxID=1347366 RepID=UPI0006D80F56|nr:spore cortex biosynthesis protein YabQ [Clostridium massiliamazoniense]